MKVLNLNFEEFDVVEKPQVLSLLLINIGTFWAVLQGEMVQYLNNSYSMLRQLIYLHSCKISNPNNQRFITTFTLKFSVAMALVQASGFGES